VTEGTAIAPWNGPNKTWQNAYLYNENAMELKMTVIVLLSWFSTERPRLSWGTLNQSLNFFSLFVNTARRPSQVLSTWSDRRSVYNTVAETQSVLFTCLRRPTTVASLSHWAPNIVYNTVIVTQRVAQVSLRHLKTRLQWLISDQRYDNLHVNDQNVFYVITSYVPISGSTAK